MPKSEKPKKAAKPDTGQYDGHRRNALFHMNRVTWVAGQVKKFVRKGDIRSAQADAAGAVRSLGQALDALVWAMEWKPRK